MEYISCRMVYISLHIRDAKKFYENNLFFRKHSSIDRQQAIIVVCVWIEQHANLMLIMKNQFTDSSSINDFKKTDPCFRYRILNGSEIPLGNASEVHGSDRVLPYVFDMGTQYFLLFTPFVQLFFVWSL